MEVLQTITIMENVKIKAFVLFCAIIAIFLLIVMLNDKKEFVELKVRPQVKYFDSSGVTSYVSSGNERRRFIRGAETCIIPENKSDSYLNCKLYTSKSVCIQTCAFGLTLKDGIQQEMKCIHDENKWMPTEKFGECKPFVDCSLKVEPGGKYKCYTNYLDKGPICEVSCEKYEDKKAVSQAEYQCDIEGKWKPELPFCAKASTDKELVPQPKGPKIVLRG